MVRVEHHRFLDQCDTALPFSSVRREQAGGSEYGGVIGIERDGTFGCSKKRIEFRTEEMYAGKPPLKQRVLGV